MVIESSVVSHTGKIRQNNEDNFFLNGIYRQEELDSTFAKTQKISSRRLVYAVCDGMGGEEYGEVASFCAVSSMEIFKEKEWSAALFEEYLENVKADMVKRNSKLSAQNMGSTFALLYLEDNTAYIANMGDSRVYLYRHGRLVQLTRDHTQARLLLDNGLLSPDEARKHVSGHILTRYLGVDNEITADDIYMPEALKMCKGDIFLICSDGLTDMLPDKTIAEYIHKPDLNNTAGIAWGLCTKALDAGGRDNITCIIAKIIKKNSRFT